MPDRILRHSLTPERPPQMGLVVLQTDETIERDLRRMVPEEVEYLVTRVAFDTLVTPETLAAMEDRIGAAAGLFPPQTAFGCVAYCCTSATAQIGPGRIADILHGAAVTRTTTNPVKALLAACEYLGLSQLGLLSPYSETVSETLRATFHVNGVETPVFGSFDVIEDARVVRIDGDSIMAGARALAATGGIEALFLSCTNLRTLDVIEPLEAELGLPVLSSNQVLAWHMLRSIGVVAGPTAPGRLFRSGDAPLVPAGR